MQVALGRFVRLYGVKEYAAVLDIKESVAIQSVFLVLTFTFNSGSGGGSQ
ncbi:MAG: hypothetical protein ACK5WZ_10880 [Pseudobdellovibrionaceae bacterium]|jgi:hypothetical protein